MFDIKSKRDKIISHCSPTECDPGTRKTLRMAENVDVEQAFNTWLVRQRARNNMLSYREMMGNDNFQARSGWVCNIKKQYGIRVLSLDGKKVSGDEPPFESFKTQFQKKSQKKAFAVNRFTMWTNRAFTGSRCFGCGKRSCRAKNKQRALDLFLVPMLLELISYGCQ